MKKIILCLILVCIPSFSFAYLAKVVGISDGDTIKILTQDKEQIKIRLYGVDAPEKDQAFGQKAKKFTSDLVFGQMVDVTNIDTDKFDRIVAFVEVNKTSLNREIVRNGLAWVYNQYCKKSECEDWKKMERAAKQSQLGLWADNNPTPPWEYRRGEKKESEFSQPNLSGHNLLHGNTQSLIFHQPGCEYYDCKKCTMQFEKRDDALSANYKPCSKCKP